MQHHMSLDHLYVKAGTSSLIRVEPQRNEVRLPTNMAPLNRAQHNAQVPGDELIWQGNQFIDQICIDANRLQFLRKCSTWGAMEIGQEERWRRPYPPIPAGATCVTVALSRGSGGVDASRIVSTALASARTSPDELVRSSTPCTPICRPRQEGNPLSTSATSRDSTGEQPQDSRQLMSFRE